MPRTQPLDTAASTDRRQGGATDPSSAFPLWDARVGYGGAALGGALAAPFAWAVSPLVEKAAAAYTTWAASNPAKARVAEHVAGDLATRAFKAAVPYRQRGGVRGAVYSYARKGFSSYMGYHRTRYTTRQKRWTKIRKSLGKFAKRWRYGRGADARTRWRNLIHRTRPRLSRYVYI